MRFRQDDFEKRISDDTLLPLSVTYEDTHLDDDDKYQYFDVFFYDRCTPEIKSHTKDDDVFRFDGYVLTPGFAKAIKTIAPYAICNEPILIEGANGTGKETLAQCIHQSSGLSGPFVCVDCGNCTPDEFSRAMIGARAGQGLVERAKDGSLYLKDIEKLTLPMQDVLFELLKPLLDTDHDDYDEEDEMQIIASCNPNIKTMLTQKKFSRDLYRILKEGYAVLPPLREHAASIFPLFKLFIESTRAKPKGTTKKVKSSKSEHLYTYDKDVKATLSRFEWPGNYDDLIRCAERVRQEVEEIPGPITGAMIKKCLTGPVNVHTRNADVPVSITETKVAVKPAPEALPEATTVVKGKDTELAVLSDQEKLIRSKTTTYLDAIKKGEKGLSETLGAYFKRTGFRGQHRIPVARRIVLAYAKFITNEVRLIRALGFVKGKPKDTEELSVCPINKNNFTTFLAELNLKLTTVRDPITYDDLPPEEQEWLRQVKRKSVL